VRILFERHSKLVVELTASMSPAGMRGAREHFGELASGEDVRHQSGAVTLTAASM
jgi:hypothetical protein